MDSTNGKLYAAWSNGQQVFFSASSDQGTHWSAAVTVNAAPANTALFPWLAAHNGTVDLVYYGTDSSQNGDGASFAQSRVSNTPNHVGVICTEGAGCAEGTRNLLDLFEVAIDPQTGRAGIIYTDDTLTTSGDEPLPQIVLAQQN